MVIVSYSGGLGDNFFQYCYARSLSQRLNYRLKAHGIPGLPGSYKDLPGIEVYWPRRRVHANSVSDFIEERRDRPVAVQMERSWQNLDVAKSSSGMWQDWLMEEGPENRAGTLGLCWGVGRDPDHCESDFDPDWLIPLLDIFTPDEMIIATQGQKAPGCKGLVKCPITHLQGDSIENLMQLISCDRLIVGTSAFDQMAGVLGMSSIVYYRGPAKSCCSTQIDIPCLIKATHGNLNGKKKWIDFSEVSSHM